VAEQLGVPYPYEPDGNGGPPLGELIDWGSGPSGGRIGTPVPLFPRLETEAELVSRAGPGQ
jgi:hypothetical protein